MQNKPCFNWRGATAISKLQHKLIKLLRGTLNYRMHTHKKSTGLVSGSNDTVKSLNFPRRLSFRKFPKDFDPRNPWPPPTPTPLEFLRAISCFSELFESVPVWYPPVGTAVRHCEKIAALTVLQSYRIPWQRGYRPFRVKTEKIQCILI